MLNDADIETTHVRDLGMQGNSDEQLLDYAAEHGLVIVSADTDFGALLAQSNDSVRVAAAFARRWLRDAGGDARATSRC